jgi:hypothetical protein
MTKIEGLPHGAIGSVAEELGVSRSLVAKVAAGERRNAKIEEALWQRVYSHEARMARIRRMRQKMEKYRFGEIDTRQQ